MIDIISGHAAIDRYLADGYRRVPGMSSRFAAAICGHVIHRQSELGMSGDMVEIGTFEGRFFIAMALGLLPGECALGIDLFNWPDDGVHDRLLKNCEAAGLSRDCFMTWKGDTRTLTPDGLRQLGFGVARFVHIDGEHSHECLSHDLELAHHALHPSGVIAVDDMLHPGYPTLIVAVLDYLKRHPDMVVVCVIDREDISAAAKFLLCRSDAVKLYEQDLMTRFARFHYIVGGDVMNRLTLVLTPQPKLADLD
jgi:predicted O-methyltransferase YrrM